MTEIAPSTRFLPEAMRAPIENLVHIGKAMEGCHEARTPDGMKKCLAWHIAHARPMIEFLPVDLRGVVQTLGNFPSSAIQSVLTIGKELMHCSHRDSPQDFMGCLGYWISQVAPSVDFLPENFERRCSEVAPSPGAVLWWVEASSTAAHKQPVGAYAWSTTDHGDGGRDPERLQRQEVARGAAPVLRVQAPGAHASLELSVASWRAMIEVFAQIGSKLMEKAMEENPALLQTAGNSKFGALGGRPIVHHSSSTLEVKTHVQRPEFLQQTAQSRHERHERGDRLTQFGWQIGDYGPQTTSLITQFNGREKSTLSCLAFAKTTS